MGLVYRIENGRLWGVDAACFFEIAPDDAEIVQLYADGKLAGEDYLIRTLRFYGHPLGELTPLDDLRAVKLSEINAAADRAIGTLTATYPDREISTFDKQEAEARAYAADPTASTPLLSALAQARGISLPDLVERVLAKADAFAVASGSIIGQRQALEDRLDACTTREEVQGITVNISMPGGGEA